MKIYQHFVPAILMTTLSLPSFAESLITPETHIDNYVKLTGFLGASLEIDRDDGTGEHDSDSSVDFSQALALNWAYAESAEGELFFSNTRKADDVDMYVQYLHVGGRILFKNTTPFSTSIALGVGGTYFNPEGNDQDDELAFSASMAAGVRYQLSDNVALRSDLRVYGTLLREGHEIFCEQTECSDGTYVEAQLLAGVEYKF